MHVLSPAPSTKSRPGAVQQASWDDFTRRATRLDETGFPLEGAFGVCWDAGIDLRGATEDEIKASIKRTFVASGREDKNNDSTVNRHAKSLLEVYNNLKKGDTIALKKGKTIVAFVELTSDYYFCPEDTSCLEHSWNYRLVRKATAADQPANGAALAFHTFFPNFLPRPTL